MMLLRSQPSQGLLAFRQAAHYLTMRAVRYHVDDRVILNAKHGVVFTDLRRWHGHCHELEFWFQHVLSGRAF
jgi:hypothetical protein